MYTKSTKLIVAQGDNQSYEMTAKDHTGTTIDLTGVQSIVFSVRSGYAGASIILKTLTDGITVTDAEAGAFTVALVPSDTSSLLVVKHTFVYSAVVTSAAGAVTTVQAGPIVVVPR